MKYWRLFLSFLWPKPPRVDGSITLEAQLRTLEDRVAALEAWQKEKGPRLETVYRKVYRDSEKALTESEPLPPVLEKITRIIRPGDPLEAE